MISTVLEIMYTLYQQVTQINKDISDAIDRSEYTVGGFIDLKKAFDAIDHIVFEVLLYSGLQAI